MEEDEVLIPLPEGVIVKLDESFGYFYYREGEEYPFLQHPFDNNAIRKLVWIYYKKKEK